MRIKTNWRRRVLLTGNDLPPKVKDRFDYLSDGEFRLPGFFLFRGNYYHVKEFASARSRKNLTQWSGFLPRGMGEAVVIKVISGKEVVVGRALF